MQHKWKVFYKWKLQVALTTYVKILWKSITHTVMWILSGDAKHCELISLKPFNTQSVKYFAYYLTTIYKTVEQWAKGNIFSSLFVLIKWWSFLTMKIINKYAESLTMLQQNTWLLCFCFYFFTGWEECKVC